MKPFDVVSVLGHENDKLKVRLDKPGPHARPLSLRQ